MTGFESHVTVLSQIDQDIHDDAMSSLVSALRWAAYVKSEKVNVSAFFKQCETEGYRFNVSLSTWSVRTSESLRVLSFLSGGTDSVSDAMSTLTTINDERVEDDLAPYSSVRALLALAPTVSNRGRKPSTRVTVTVSADIAETFVTTCDDRAELVKLAEMVAQRLAELDNATVDATKLYEAA